MNDATREAVVDDGCGKAVWLHRLRVVTGDNTTSTECRWQHLPTGQYTEISDLQTMRIHRSANYYTVLLNNPKVLSAP